MSHVMKIALFLAMFAAGQVVGSAWASAERPRPCQTRECESRPGGGGSGGMPDPLAFINQKVELADGEYYLLQGEVVFAPGVGGRRMAPYLSIDLRDYPWLANEKRRETPLYPIEGEASYWHKLQGKSIRLTFQAHGQVIDGEYVISITPLIEYDPPSGR